MKETSVRILCVFGRQGYGNVARGEGYEHRNFVPALRKMGYDVHVFDIWDRGLHENFCDLNTSFVNSVCALKPDLILCALMTYELWTETLDLVRDHSDAVIINWGTDDSWKYEQFSRFIGRHVDCYATTSRDAYRKAGVDGLNNFVLSQWAANSRDLTKPKSARSCRFPVTFIGSAYGNRRRWIEALGKCGIQVSCFGYGWPGGAIDSTAIPRIMHDSVISLNFGDSGLQFKGLVPYRSRQIKARVFEVPGAGGFLLTEPADNLEQYYRFGEEVDVFSDVHELADKIRFYLERPSERDRVAEAGHWRTVREHTYESRFETLFLDALRLKSAPAPWKTNARITASGKNVEDLCAAHRPSAALKILRASLVGPGRLLFGKERGARAARRLLFELSWRLAGEKTYSVSGWPGRLFYAES